MQSATDAESHSALATGLVHCQVNRIKNKKEQVDVTGCL